MSKGTGLHQFYNKRWVYFTISIAIMVIGIIFTFVKGVQLDIQFKGGALLKYTYEGELNEKSAEDKASELLGRPVTTQLTSDLASDEKKLVINIAGNYGVEASEQQKFDDSLKEAFPDNNLKLSESSMVEPFFGQKFLTNGIIALVLASTLVMCYVWMRFRKIGGLSAGVMAIIALVHDVMVVFFTCVIFGIPIGESFVAVALSIIGYSINDTIVIYDRIRENSRTYTKLPVDQLTDLSISQCMMRSVMTSFAVFISVTSVYVLAFAHDIESIQSFALPMAIGTISGCYSTICIAGPLWVSWKKHKAKLKTSAA